MFVHILKAFVILSVLGIIGGTAGAFYILYEFGRDLPDYRQLAAHEPDVTSRVHAGDGRLIAEFARERRVFVPIEAIPPVVQQAFIAAEDQRFYEHYGVDPIGVFRAVVTNLQNAGNGRRLVGASSITQQVAKNFLLTNEVSYVRKIKEAILAVRIERALSKDRILELYLNEIYLGQRAYGVAAASLNYFDKSLDELTAGEAAYLAALPKAPNNYHPIRQVEAAVGRRNYVLGRMLEDGYIGQDIHDQYVATDSIGIQSRTTLTRVDAGFFVEEVRREVIEEFGEDQAYGGGLSVRTTLDSNLQEIANRALRNGLEAYDRRHGYRGPVDQFEITPNWVEQLAEAAVPPGLPYDWTAAVVLAVTAEGATIGLETGASGTVPLEVVTWAREALRRGMGPRIRAVTDVLEVGDVILVAPSIEVVGQYELKQVPTVSGGLVAMDPHTGRVLAMVGGFSFEMSEFNRATQALRQPGSAFKPVIYTAALEHGYTPASKVLDAPFVIDQGPGQGKWKPGNYSDEFYGPSTLRLGMEKSRNLMTIRLAQDLGMNVVADYARRMGVTDNLPELLSMSLGAGETTLLRMTMAYAMLVNGGKHVTPTLIDRVQDRYGATIFRHDGRVCEGCGPTQVWTGQDVPEIADNRDQVLKPTAAYQMVSMLEGVVQRGTGRRISQLEWPLAGKTGTTNNQNDTWFVGFAPDLAVGVYIGFDNPRGLGRGETGSSVAAPVFKQFMAEALQGQPATPFRIPQGVRLVRVNSDGLPARPGDTQIIEEAFLPGTEPTEADRAAPDAYEQSYTSGSTPLSGTGGLY